MIQSLTLVFLVVGLVLPWWPKVEKNRNRLTELDFGSMPADERYADWS